MNDWSKLVEAAGLAVEHDSETIAEMSLRIAELEADLEERTDMLKTLIGNIDTLFAAYPEKMPFEDAMRHWQRCARELLQED